MADALLTSGHAARVTVQVRSTNSPWYSVEVYRLDAQGHVYQQYGLPFREPEPRDLDEAPVRRKVGRPKGVARPPMPRLTPWDRAQLRERARQRQIAAELREPPTDGLPSPLARGQFGNVGTTDDQPTQRPAPAGLPTESLSWILRGLYQEQWEDILERRYHPYEAPVTDRYLSVRVGGKRSKWMSAEAFRARMARMGGRNKGRKKA
jgi:hypothetical protein